MQSGQVLSDRKFNAHCERRLVEYGRRKTNGIARHINGLCRIAETKSCDVIRSLLGGSIKKGTYVSGLSDVDVLLLINESHLVSSPPAKVIRFVKDTIQTRLPQNEVTAGHLAVTVKYADGAEIQLLPAIRRKDGVRIADRGGKEWSAVVHPDRFVQKLTKVNQTHNGRAVQVIKLAKAMAENAIEVSEHKITGYHMESLAIEAFNNYNGPSDSKSMLNHLLEYSRTAVVRPIADSTGQSRHVDDYLGPLDSKARKRTANYLGQIKDKMNACKSTTELDNLLGM